LGPIRGKIRKRLINLQKSSSHEALAGMPVKIFSLGEEIQVCSNEIPRVMYPRGLNFDIVVCHHPMVAIVID